MVSQQPSPALWNKKRSFFAVLAGFSVTFLLATVLAVVLRAALPGLYPDFSVNAPGAGGSAAGLLVNVLSTFVASIAGGYMGAVFADRAPVNHGLAVGVLMMFVSFAVGSGALATQPLWYMLLVPLAFVLGGGVGGRLRGLKQTAKGKA